MDRAKSQSTVPVVADLQPAGGEQSAQIYDCWTTIGVGGNGSCRELTRFTHCRNCPVYSAAAAQLLDRPIAPEHRREWTEHFAREKKLTTPARISVVIFRVGSEWLALSTPAFQEVAERRSLHTLPHRRQGVVLGLVNIRGELLICVSLGRLLGIAQPLLPGVNSSARATSPSSHAPRAGPVERAGLDARLGERLLVANWDGDRLVFPVDEVHGIRRVHHDELRDPPATVAKAVLSCTRAVFPWRDHSVGLLEAEVLFAMLHRNLS